MIGSQVVNHLRVMGAQRGLGNFAPAGIRQPSQPRLDLPEPHMVDGLVYE